VGLSLRDRQSKERGCVPMKGNSFVLWVLVLAILYIISPIDLIPDAIPVIGWVDDAAVAAGAGAIALAAGRR
jgi:uncharacterized membrane protein YkvA (DUF1232 family)